MGTASFLDGGDGGPDLGRVEVGDSANLERSWQRAGGHPVLHRSDGALGPGG